MTFGQAHHTWNSVNYKNFEWSELDREYSKLVSWSV